MNSSKPEPLWTSTEVAAYLGIRRQTVNLWCREGRLPHLMLSGRLLRFDPEEIFKWAGARASCRCHDGGGTSGQPTTTT